MAKGKSQNSGSGRVKKNRRRKRRLRVGMILVVLVACAVFAVLSLTTLFRVESFVVSGELGRYTPEQVTEASGVALGTNLFSVKTGEVSARIEEQLPYVREATVKIRLPDRILIEVGQTQAAAVVETNLGCFQIDDTHKILAEAEPADGLIFRGIVLDSVQIGRRAQYSDENAASILSALMNGLRETGMDAVQDVDLTDLYAIEVQYNDLLTIKLGGATDLQKKLRFARYVIDEKLDPAQRGTLDLSVNVNQAIFRPDYGSMDIINRPPESVSSASSVS